jgi:hypothetical protein
VAVPPSTSRALSLLSRQEGTEMRCAVPKNVNPFKINPSSGDPTVEAPSTQQFGSDARRETSILSCDTLGPLLDRLRSYCNIGANAISEPSGTFATAS